jgi:hypothetical protein
MHCSLANLKTYQPFFIDKMPNNFRHVGLIQDGMFSEPG